MQRSPNLSELQTFQYVFSYTVSTVRGFPLRIIRQSHAGRSIKAALEMRKESSQESAMDVSADDRCFVRHLRPEPSSF
jgi:hypothetical protein